MVESPVRGRRPLLAAVLLLAGAAPAAPGEEAPADVRHGSAIVLDPSGYLATSLSLVEGEGGVTVTFGGDPLPATVVARDEEQGLALLRIDRAGLPAARLGSYGSERGAGSVLVLGVRAPPEPGGIHVVPAQIPEPAGRDAPALLAFPESPPAGFAGAAVVNRIGQVVGLLGRESPGAAPGKGIPFAGCRALWDLARSVPDPAPTIPGAPMHFGAGEEGARALYGGAIARVRFEPGGIGKGKGKEKGKAAVPAAPPPPPADSARHFPSGGLDVVRTTDGRTLRCRAGTPDPKSGAVLLEFDAGSLLVPQRSVLEILRFRDYDPVPRTPDEEAKAARGLVRWKGEWVQKWRADAAVREAEESLRARRKWEREGCDWEDRTVHETPNFRIESNAPGARIAGFSELLEQFRRFLGHYLPRGVRFRPVPVYIFRDREEFAAFADRDVGRRSEHTVGYFAESTMDRDARLVLYDLPGQDALTRRVLLHEATHLFLYLADTSAMHPGLFPQWLNEGLAEYFGGAVPRGGTFREGGVQDERLLRLQEMVEGEDFIPLETLVRDHGVETSLEVAKGFGLDHYAESWGFVHFLLHARNSSYRGAFRNYFVATVEDTYGYGPNDERLLRVVLERKDFRKVTEEFKAYVRGLAFSDPESYALRAARRFAAGKDPAGAEADLRTALERGKGDPEVVRAVAAVLARLPGREAEAVATLRKALESDPLDPATRRALLPLLPLEERVAELRLCEALDPE